MKGRVGLFVGYSGVGLWDGFHFRGMEVKDRRDGEKKGGGLEKR